MTTITTLSEFLEKPTEYIDSCIMYEEFIKIKADKGTAVLITEAQFDAFLELLIKTNTKNKK